MSLASELPRRPLSGSSLLLYPLADAMRRRAERLQGGTNPTRLGSALFCSNAEFGLRADVLGARAHQLEHDAC